MVSSKIPSSRLWHRNVVPTTEVTASAPTAAASTWANRRSTVAEHILDTPRAIDPGAAQQTGTGSPAFVVNAARFGPTWWPGASPLPGGGSAAQEMASGDDLRWQLYGGGSAIPCDRSAVL